MLPNSLPNRLFFLAAPLVVLALTACSTPPPKPSNAHLSAKDVAPAAAGRIPQPLRSTVTLPPPSPAPKSETYSVVVHEVGAQELLFALARDAKVNVDIHPGISGTITLNAINQTLPQILSRIARQIDMRFELDGNNLVVTPDTPYLQMYTVDYVNLSRDVKGSVSILTQIASTGGNATGDNSTNSANAANLTQVDNQTRNRFWESLEQNIKDLLRETDKIIEEPEKTPSAAQTQAPLATNSSNPVAKALEAVAGAVAVQPSSAPSRVTFREAASVIINRETGTIAVRATSRQQERVREFIDRVALSSKRQVLIEATIVEVELSNEYQQGINWSRVRADNSGFTVTTPTLSSAPSSGVTPYSFNVKKSSLLNLDLTLKMLDAFGTVKVLSSPRLSVLNNQTALLKVVENYVYFEVESDSTNTQNAQTENVTTKAKSVAVGLVMAVTPQISDHDHIILNVRPTISSISAVKRDPNPKLTIENNVPQIKTREIESVMRIQSGDIAVLGGLMEDRSDYRTGDTPGISSIPIIGELFTTRNNSWKKSELVIFIRPVVIRDASLAADYSGYRSYLPAGDFTDQPDHAKPFALPQQTSGARP